MKVILTPLQTERSRSAAQAGKFTFLVLRGATKGQIKETVQRLFKVDVVAVHTANIPGKTKKVGRFIKETPGYKKAIVRLKKGQTIDLFETEKKKRKTSRPKI